MKVQVILRHILKPFLPANGPHYTFSRLALSLRTIFWNTTTTPYGAQSRKLSKKKKERKIIPSMMATSLAHWRTHSAQTKNVLQLKTNYIKRRQPKLPDIYT